MVWASICVFSISIQPCFPGILIPSCDGVGTLMHQGRIIFSQLMDHFPKYEFDKLVDQHRAEYRTRQFSCLDQFLAMAFAQLTGRESLRDIQTCLGALRGKLYHAGFRGHVARSTLADANDRRPWQLWADLTLRLIATARKLYINEDFGIELGQVVYALDSSTIDLCLSLFPWASFRKHKAGIKLHTLLDLRGNIPACVIITPALLHDINVMDEICTEAGAIYIVDRGYLDFARLWRLKSRLAFFVTRAKRNSRLRRIASRPVDAATGLICDQNVVLSVAASRRDYPEPLRRVVYVDAQTRRRYVFLTNHFELPALGVARLYKCRWQVELFFKWIKQHLRIKTFFGTSDNAVRTQIWIAIGIYVLVAVVRKRLGLRPSLYSILQVLGLTLFEKMPIKSALSEIREEDVDSINIDMQPKQLVLFDL